MAIKFDTLEELKAFCLNFQLTVQSVDAVESTAPPQATPKKRGRKPGSKNKTTLALTSDTAEAPKKRGRKPKLKGTDETVLAGVPKKRGRKPGSLNKVKNLGTAKRGRKPAAAREN